MARAARGRARARYFENTTLRHARNHHEPNLAQYETGFQGHYETQSQITNEHSNARRRGSAEDNREGERKSEMKMRHRLSDDTPGVSPSLNMTEREEEEKSYIIQGTSMRIFQG